MVFLLVLGGGFGTLSALANDEPRSVGGSSPMSRCCPHLLSQLFFAQGVEQIGANRASLFNNLIPVFGTILSVLLLRETLEPYHFIAAAIVVAGIVLAEVSARRG